MRIKETLSKLFGGRSHQAIYVEHSTAPTLKLREADEAARLASAVLHFKAFCDYVEALPEDTKQLIRERGGDAWAARKLLPELEANVRAAIPPAVLWGPDTSRWLQTAQPLQPRQVDQVRAEVMKFQTQQHAELEALAPVALKAEPSEQFQFVGLFRHWAGLEPDGSGRVRVREPRHFEATAKLLEKCFPKRDYRSITVDDALYFAQWMNEAGVGPATQANRLMCARAMYKRAWQFMRDRKDPNPFEKVEAVAQHVAEDSGKFTTAQLNAILKLAARLRWGDTRIAKRHEAAMWLLKLCIFTGARIGALCRLKKTDVHKHEPGKFYFLSFRRETVKARKDEDKSYDHPLHPAIGEAFHDWAKAQKGPGVFEMFNCNEDWIGTAFPAFLREHADALGVTLRDGKPVDRKDRPLKLHSLRHTFTSAMINARLSADAQRMLMGRKGKDVHESVYGTDMALEELYKDVSRLKPLG